MSTEVAHTAAIKALLTAGNANPYTLQDLEDYKVAHNGALPESYNEVYVTERLAEGHRFGGRSDKRAWRVQTRAVARVEDNAKTMRTRARDALEDKSVTVSGVESTAMERGASDDPIRPDEPGWFSGLSEFIYYC